VGDGIRANIWMTMGEEIGSEPPVGLGDAIYDRVRRLKASIKFLCKALERSGQRDGASAMLPPASHRSVESDGQFRKKNLHALE
jgi:hypothetical protein